MLGVGLSVDGGVSWQATTGFSSWEINDFTWDPSDPRVVWVGTLSGPYRSSDGGKTWTAKRTGLPRGDFPYSAPIQKVAIDPSDAQHLLAFGGNQRLFMPGGSGALNYGRVYESHDGGDSWTAISTVGLNANIMSVAYGRDLQTLFVAVKDVGVLKSTNGGNSWQSASTGLPHRGVRDLAIDPNHPDHLWAALDRAAPEGTSATFRAGGVYKTVDGGRSWTAANRGLSQIEDRSAALTSAMYSVYRASDGALYTADQGYRSQRRFKSTDGGASWSSISAIFPKFYTGGPMPYVWAASAHGNRILGGTADTLMASDDRGSTWRDVGSTRKSDGTWRGNGFSGLLGKRVVFNARRPGQVFLNGYDGGNVLRSDNGGFSWSRAVGSWDSYGGAYGTATGGSTGAIAYALAGQAGRFNGLLVSTDAGKTWVGRAGGSLPARGSQGRNVGSVAVASRDGSKAYAVLPDGALYATSDTGRSWTKVATPSPPYSVAVSSDYAKVYLGTDRGVYIRTGEGGFSLDPGSPVKVQRLVLDQNGTLYGVGELGGPRTTAGLWRQTGGGWSQIHSDKWTADVAVDPTDPSVIALVTDDNPYHATSFATGVWISRDGGQTFERFNTGLAMLRVMSVAFDPWTPGRLVIGTNGRGFWQTQL